MAAPTAVLTSAASKSCSSRGPRVLARQCCTTNSAFRTHTSSTQKRFFALSSAQQVNRLNHFSKLEPADVDYFKSVTTVHQGDMDRYNIDWLKLMKGKSELALRPRSTEEVSKILKYCNDRKLAVTPQGGNTGLVGGAIPVFDEIILSLELMNKIVSIDEKAGVGIFEAGAILEQVNTTLENDYNLIFPLDLGAKGSCQIGGNIATNAGGLRVLRYGNLHGSVLGLEFVKANGEVVDVLSRNKKDNTGIDLKQLMIGSEGVLGVITKAAVMCPPKCNAKHVLLLSVDNYDDVVSLFQKARSELGEILSAYEFWDAECTENLSKNLPDLPAIPEFLLPEGNGKPKFGVLVETSGSNAEHDSEKLFQFLEKHELESGSIASDLKQYAEFWRFREDIPEAMLKAKTKVDSGSKLFAYDVTLPEIDKLYLLVEESRTFLTKLFDKDPDFISNVVGYGHIGDGNLHLNLTTNAAAPVELEEKMIKNYEPFLWQLVKDLNGSISAEHGIGSAKTDVIHYSKSKEAIELMYEIKKCMDPNMILNPYKVLCNQQNPVLVGDSGLGLGASSNDAVGGGKMQQSM
ncbi:unnamed protein product [Amoebophrya sp. A120]|nr:unnamed protein product [Amoebophrya sp. A120]|eukprot:GSA120T00022467001.1